MFGERPGIRSKAALLAFGRNLFVEFEQSSTSCSSDIERFINFDVIWRSEVGFKTGSPSTIFHRNTLFFNNLYLIIEHFYDDDIVGFDPLQIIGDCARSGLNGFSGGWRGRKTPWELTEIDHGCSKPFFDECVKMHIWLLIL